MQTFLIPGIACNSRIWHKSKDYISSNLIKIEWPSSGSYSFTKLNDVSNWLLENLTNKVTKDDSVIAHSMGGLAILQLVAQSKLSFRHVVIVESFLNPPSEFFQNLHFKDTDIKIKSEIESMLNNEKTKYNQKIFSHLRAFKYDFERFKIKKNMNISFIYGDRGYPEKLSINEKLKWPRNFDTNINLYLINNSCHFPMLENPVEFYNTIQTLQEKQFAPRSLSDLKQHSDKRNFLKLF